VLDPSRAAEVLGADVVVGVPAERDRAAASEAALAVQLALRELLPGRSSLAVVLTSEAEGTVEPGTTLVPSDGTRPPPAIHAGSPGPAAALHTLLDVAVAVRAPACALLEPMPRPAGADWLRALLDPVLRGEADLVAPSYARRRFEGVLVTGLVYPLTRALFGQRLRQPLGREIVLSLRLAEHLSRDDAWRADPAHAGTDLWVITMAVVRECRFAQVFLGQRPVPQAQPPDVSDALARVLGTLFHEMDLHASRWQRVRGSCAVATFGEEHLPEEPGHAPAPRTLVDSFALGLQDLRRLWSPVLPPQALYALQRIAREPAEGFRIPDTLWARVVYDFAVGWRVKAMERQQLLRSMTPLYLGWVASFVNEVAALDWAGVDERVERLAAAFEAEKPYLISRWRWPDRFSP
jgi:hypothetical protein